ncbi:MAG: hypothetical protein KatS3mg011_1515 [Acidimicrobiia bacterium]|nr:MAG: hypothetical protein KatS3mg011_1515 [Acidimicrobiia bacterium]
MPVPAEPRARPEAVEVGSVAAWYAADYFTSTEPPTYVERAVPVSVERLGPELHAVVVLVQVLARDELGYRRLEPKAVEVVVDTSDGIRVVDRPQPADTRISFDTVELDSTDLPQELVDRAVELATAAGSPLAETAKGAEFEGGWRIEIDVVDEAGIAWPMVVWLDHGGDPINPPG